MKILKQGKPGEWWEGKVGECKRCGASVELQAGDAVSVTADRDGPIGAVKCPMTGCGGNIFVYPASPDHDCRWKTRAAQHGCDVVNGDHECG